MNLSIEARRISMLAGLIVSLSGCTAVKNVVSPPGEMTADGTINQCHGHKADAQACGNALYNSTRIGKVAIGQSIAEVRQIMGHDPEQRSVQALDGHSAESWSYRTDYQGRITTRIEFRDAVVVGIKQERP
jgi:hypothetical protein